MIRVARMGEWCQCPNCLTWHILFDSVFCERCRRYGITEWTVATARNREPKWWR